MDCTYTTLLHGCLFSSIAHAIMTNVYPDLFYEQSWDGCSFSMVDGCGRRGTISFATDFCVGAIRNDEYEIVSGEDTIISDILEFSAPALNLAIRETLQYLLDDIEGEAIPSISSIFYCDQAGIRTPVSFQKNFQKDMTLFYPCFLPYKQVVAAIKEYYNMDTQSLMLLEELFRQKREDLSAEIVLDKRQVSLIPGDGICQECINSLAELKIYIQQSDVKN